MIESDMEERDIDTLQILFLESFYGGSHKDFADGLRHHSRHSFDMHCLPAETWKRRIRNAALQMAADIANPQEYHGVLSGGMLSLADLRALWREKCPPVILYAHETQLHYPLQDASTRHDEFYHTDISNMLAADAVLFNSHSHYTACMRNAAEYMERACGTKRLLEDIQKKSKVACPGCWFPSDPVERPERPDGPLCIIWNHRWEFDKHPEVFLKLLQRLHDAGKDFRLVLLGEGSHNRSRSEILKRFKAQIIHAGYLPGRDAYYRMLQRGDVVISTAKQENFGIAVVEAMYFGCLPLLPDRLSYPELVPPQLEWKALYENDEELLERLSLLADAISDPDEQSFLDGQRRLLSGHMTQYSWQKRAEVFDQLLFDSCSVH
ncbi:MAG: tRNA-queuosine alpha-mannosyltransferase domain-containing protein [Spirochaeta sp.]